MLVFVLGSLAFSAFLGWQTFVEWSTNRPDGWRSWLDFSLIIAAQVCVLAVIVKAAFS